MNPVADMIVVIQVLAQIQSFTIIPVSIYVHFYWKVSVDLLVGIGIWDEFFDQRLFELDD